MHRELTEMPVCALGYVGSALNRCSVTWRRDHRASLSRNNPENIAHTYINSNGSRTQPAAIFARRNRKRTYGEVLWCCHESHRPAFRPVDHQLRGFTIFSYLYIPKLFKRHCPLVNGHAGKGRSWITPLTFGRKSVGFMLEKFEPKSDNRSSYSQEIQLTGISSFYSFGIFTHLKRPSDGIWRHVWVKFHIDSWHWRFFFSNFLIYSRKIKRKWSAK